MENNPLLSVLILECKAKGYSALLNGYEDDIVSCAPCPKGWYKPDDVARHPCYPCPPTTTTATNARSSVGDCGNLSYSQYL